MTFKIQNDGDPWFKQLQITFNGYQIAYYQNALTHCCGLSGLGHLFPYPNSDLSKKQVDDFVQLLQSYVDNEKPLRAVDNEYVLFSSPEVMFTTSEENEGTSIEWLKKHPKVSKKWEFKNKNTNVVTVWAISLDFNIDEDYL